ncbi:MAG: DUF1501 domain-containing protein [Pirellulaceae bacterium]|nr:DUF1501 domain-containing protein [Pirellulaceae bacterium]
MLAWPTSSLVSRRRMLRVGLLSLGGLGLADLLRLRANAVAKGEDSADTAVILLWLGGGPSHLETYDLKPRAPVEYRGEFQPIPTNVPGIELCEHLPLHAKIADKFALIRSITHDIADHPGATGRFLTGRTPANISDPVSKFPTFDAVVAKMREGRSANVPHFVSNLRALKGGGSAYLGATCEPFVVEGDPHAPDFQVQNLALEAGVAERLDDRRQLLASFDSLRRNLDSRGLMAAGDRFHQRAIELLAGGQARAAFDLAAEPANLRDKYGRNAWGQGALLARRLVEAGCAMVTLDWNYLSPAVASWDDHGDAQHLFQSMKIRLPVYDRAVTSLIDDLHHRGLSRRVLVIATGEFGRTPQVNLGRAKVPKWPGRDHWPGAMSVLVAGGGWTMGQVIGSTNSRGEFPHERPLDPNDFLASIYRFLGIDASHSFLDHRGRPMPILTHGEPIAELG